MLNYCEVPMRSIEEVISKQIGKTLFKYRMIEENDRILVAVSGGKDSLTMLHDLKRRKKSFPVKFDFVAVHIKTDFCNCSKKTNLENIFKEWEVEYRIVDVPVIGRLKPGRKMNCYWCSTQRRMELLKLAKVFNCNKIALGHHLDDIIETFLMNICLNGETATMLPSFQYEKYPYTVIRPLAMLPESLIIKFAKSINIDRIVCKCPYGQNSKRKEIREAIKLIAKNNKSARRNIFKSMHNVNSAYMLK
jgi:tRNA 2-thiocytidine biosynthesis protein TtcA